MYLFWSGLVTALIASGTYIAYVASAAVALRRFSALTTLGTVTVSSSTGVPNPGIGRLATAMASITAGALAGAVATRWAAVGHAPFSNLYEFTLAFAAGIAAVYVIFEVATRQRRMGVLALP